MITYLQITEIRHAIHDLNAAHTGLDLAAQLAAEGKYNTDQLDAVRRDAFAKAEKANARARRAFEGEVPVEDAPPDVIRVREGWDANGTEAV